MQAFPQFTVVDSRLQAGRGEEFSASRQKEQAELAHAQQSYDDAEPWHLPIGHQPQDSLDTEGLTMASTDTAIPEDNKGYRMLQKMGWKGAGLGRDENGIIEPVKGGVEAGLRLGVGKAEQESFYTAADNVVRKKLEVEIQAEEDQDRRGRREMNAERAEQIKQDVSNIQQSFYCQTCHKQYKNAFEMEAHISSYDHHHRKRLIEMRTDEAERTRGIRDKKEKKRADKEMARLQAQIQAAQAAVAPSSSSAAASASAAASTVLPSTEDQPPLPPLPPEEEDPNQPPPPPPPDPLPPHQPMPPLPSTSVTSQHTSQHGRHSSQWSQPSTAMSNMSHRHQVPSASSQAAGYSGADARQHQARVPIKQEPGLYAGDHAVKVEEPADRQLPSNLGHVKAEAQPPGVIQFGFGSQHPTGNKGVGVRRPAAVSRKPVRTMKPNLAAFGNADSDDDAS